MIDLGFVYLYCSIGIDLVFLYLDNDSPCVSLPGFGDSSFVCLPGLVVTLKYLFACNKWCSPCFCLHGLSVCLFTLIESWSFCD